jgi:hypothetical protein
MGASAPAVPRVHGLSPAGDAVHFGIAVWPYDLLLRFGYDLPENEHMWPGEWFDDTFEAAAMDLRSDAAKLVLAVRATSEAIAGLAAAAGETPAPDVKALRRAVETAPLALDLVVAYLARIRVSLAAIIPCCYGVDGQAFGDARGELGRMAGLANGAVGDPALAGLLSHPPRLSLRTNRPDLYVVSGNEGFAAALPKSAARALRTSAAVTLEAASALGTLLADECAWLDRVLAHLQGIVAARAEDGPDLLERWADPAWSVVATLPPDEVALGRYLPATQ